MTASSDGLPTTLDKFLGGQLSIEQPAEGYRAGQDAVLLAAACPAQVGETVLELGCGVGTALLCLGLRTGADLTGVDVTTAAVELADRNCARNRVTAEILAADLADLPMPLRDKSFDHVIINPPYFGPGKASPVPERDLARREQTPLSIWVDVALRRLKPGGTITVIHLAERLAEVLLLLNGRAGRFQIKPISPRANKIASRVVVRATKGAANSTTLFKPLILHAGDHHNDAQRDVSPEADSILRNGDPLEF